MPKLRLIQSIAHPCKVANEDLFCCNDQAAWIFDGVTGIGPQLIASAPTDPYWLVHAANQALVDAWRDDVATRALCATAAARVIAKFVELATPPAELVDLPTSCWLMARLWEGQLEVSMAGDCTLLLARAGVGVTEVGLDLSDFARPARRELARLTAAGVAPADLLGQLAPFERQVRLQANIEGGYAIVDLTTRWPARIAQRHLDVGPGDQLLITTDGLYRLVETFGRYTAETLMAAVLRHGLPPLYEELRALEAADEACSARPRAKVRDDVAAALLVVDR